MILRFMCLQREGQSRRFAVTGQVLAIKKLHCRRPCFFARLILQHSANRGSVCDLGDAPSGSGTLPGVLSGIRPISRNGVMRDARAGIGLAATSIPQVLGYTRIAGMPVATGFYTLLLPLLA